MQLLTPASGSLPRAPRLTAGVDVSRDQLDLDFHPDPQPLRFPNTAAGVRALKKAVQKAEAYCVVVESTGGCERLLLNTLLDARIRVVHIQPSRVRAFAKALGIHLKNDLVDASLLARFGQIQDLRLMPPRDPPFDRIKALATRRNQLVHARNAELCRARQTADPDAKASVLQMIKVMDRMIDKVHERIDQRIGEHPRSKNLYAILIQVKGVGPPTARLLTAMLPEIGLQSDKRLNSLVGVAPFDNDSGAGNGRRKILGGRAPVRAAMYACCIAGLRNTPELKALYDRLAARGLAHNTAMTACVRKLIAYINRRVRAAFKGQAAATPVVAQ